MTDLAPETAERLRAVATDLQSALAAVLDTIASAKRTAEELVKRTDAIQMLLDGVSQYFMHATGAL